MSLYFSILITSIECLHSSRQELKQNLVDSRLQIDSLVQQIEELTSAASQTESQQEKLTQVNSKLKRALQTLKEKIQRVAVDRSDLFANVGEETSERLDHLIATLESQATQIDSIRVERDRVEQQSNTQIRDLQR